MPCSRGWERIECSHMMGMVVLLPLRRDPEILTGCSVRLGPRAPASERCGAMYSPVPLSRSAGRPPQIEIKPNSRRRGREESRGRTSDMTTARRGAINNSPLAAGARFKWLFVRSECRPGCACVCACAVALVQGTFSLSISDAWFSPPPAAPPGKMPRSE